MVALVAGKVIVVLSVPVSVNDLRTENDLLAVNESTEVFPSVRVAFVPVPLGSVMSTWLNHVPVIPPTTSTTAVEEATFPVNLCRPFAEAET
jgi:hypothetical protein